VISSAALIISLITCGEDANNVGAEAEDTIGEEHFINIEGKLATLG